MGQADVSATVTNHPTARVKKTPATSAPDATRPPRLPFEDALGDPPDFPAAPDEAMVSISPAPPPDSQSGTNHAVITPQMLVQFFTANPGSSNGPGVSVALPLDALKWNQSTGGASSTAVLTNR